MRRCRLFRGSVAPHQSVSWIYSWRHGLQVEAIRNIKIDKITVWDGAGGRNEGTATSQFVSGLIKSLPPLHDVAGLAGIELPKYLGKIAEEKLNGGLAETIGTAEESGSLEPGE